MGRLLNCFSIDRSIYRFQVGYNLSDEFTVNWWEHLFNHTAKKIDKATKKAQVAVQTAVKEEEEKEAKTAEEKTASPEKAGVQLNSNKSFYYSRFPKVSESHSPARPFVG